ncbi:MAG: hypothetical protein ACOCRK_04355 [bacterium]
MKLLNHKKVNGFNYFEMEGEKDKYILTVIKIPHGFYGYGWDDKYYIVINESTDVTNRTNSKTNNSYKFTKQYFSGQNTEYLPKRIGISKVKWEDFMDCVTKFVYPEI